MKHRYLAVGALLATAGCATAPEAITPSYVSPVQYQNFTCDQLGQEAARVDAALAASSAQQRKARSNDTAGVLLLGLPVSSMGGGNIAPQVALLKGQTVAIQQAANQKNCGR